MWRHLEHRGSLKSIKPLIFAKTNPAYLKCTLNKSSSFEMYSLTHSLTRTHVYRYRFYNIALAKNTNHGSGLEDGKKAVNKSALCNTQGNKWNQSSDLLTLSLMSSWGRNRVWERQGSCIFCCQIGTLMTNESASKITSQAVLRSYTLLRRINVPCAWSYVTL